MRRMAVVINQKAGSIAMQQEPGILARMVDLFRGFGVAAEVELLEVDRMAETARQAIAGKWDALVAGGGDGTVSALAGILAGTKIPLGVLPLGTYNHFAKDLNVPLDLENAIRSVALSEPRPVDLAEVNKHFFVNNSSIGIYPHAVEEREMMRRQTKLSKQVLMIWAAVKVLFRRPLVRVRLEMLEEQVKRTTPFVFVGNNCYSLGLTADKLRPCLDGGCLFVLAARDVGFWSLGRLAWRALRNRLRESEELDLWRTRELVIRTHRRHMRVSLDGEVLRLQTPLHYRIHPQALQVIAPA